MPRNLALNVSVGAIVDKSLGAAYKAATKSTKQLGKEYKETNKKLKATQDIQKYRRQLDALKKKQAETGDTSGRLAAGITNLEKKYRSAKAAAKRYGIEVGQIVKEEKRLTDQLKKQQRAQKMKAAGAKIGGGMKSAATGAASMLGPAGLIGGTVIGGGMTALVMTNKMAAANANLAASVGMTAANYRMWDGIMEQAGLSGENVVDLMEEMTNKMGEAKGLDELPSGLADAIHILGLDFEYLKKLKPEQQFMEIMKAAEGMDDQQLAQTAVDMLMGGEANKVLGYLRDQGKSVNELVKEWGKYNVVTDESISGAKLFSDAWSKFTFVMGGAFQELSGLVGGVLAPQLIEWAKQFSDFLTNKDNREAIKKFSAGFGETLVQLGKGIALLAQNLPTIISGLSKILGWFADDDEPQESGIARANRLRAERRAQVAEAGENRGTERAAMIRGGNVTNQPNITINQQPGESGDELAKRVVNEEFARLGTAPKYDDYSAGMAS